MNINKLPLNMRPREKMIMQGEETLSNRELLAIILRTGHKGGKLNALNLADNLLERFSGLSGLSNASFCELMKEKGIGNAKACQIRASIEMAKRILDIDYYEIAIKNSNDAYKCFRSILWEKEKECFAVLHLDTRHRVKGRYIVSTGTLDFCLCHPREIFSRAVKNNISAIIVAHNHPSGSLKPSKEDINSTNKLKQAGEIIGINILDHLIISNSGYFSFADKHLIPK